MRLLIAFAILICAVPWSPSALADDDDEAMLLVAHPSFRDLDYRQTVVLAAPGPNRSHIGVILNRPTRSPLSRLFPEHGPSKNVVEPVYIGGPMARGALVALVKADTTPGDGSVQVMKNLYLAFRVNTIDQVIETHPNDARYYVGYVAWRPGELKSEIERGIWSVLSADMEVVFRKDTEGLWEEMLQQTRRIRAKTGTDHVFQTYWKTWSVPDFQAAAFTVPFSKVIFDPR